MAIYFDITIFASDDVTPLLGAGNGATVPPTITEASFSTDPAHPRPYLIDPTGSARAESRIDVFRGSGVVGEITCAVNDNPRAGFDQQGGIYTWLLAGTNGESQLIGRRVVKRCIVDGVPTIMYDGVHGSPQLNDDLASYSFGVRDIRERTRLGVLFPSACIRDAAGAIIRAPTILPAGTFHDYGQLQPGIAKYASPAAVPVRGYYNAARKQIRWQIGDWDQKKLKRYQVASKHMLEIGSPRLSQTNDIFPVTLKHVENVSILWRPTTGGAWTECTRQNITGLGPNLFHLDPEALYNAQAANGILGIFLNPTSGAVPADGQVIDFLVVYTGPPTEVWPLHLSGTFGSVLKEICDGVYSPTYNAALGIKPLRIIYNTTRMNAFAAETALCRARIFASVEGKDAPAWLARNIFQPSFSAPGLDENWALVPIRGNMPDASVTLLQLTNDNTAPDSPKWIQDAGSAITIVSVKFPIETVDDTDVFGERTAGDRIAEIEDGFQAKYESASIAEVGEQSLEVAPITVRDAAVVNVGFPFNTQEEVFGQASSIVLKLKDEIFDRARYGVQRFPLLASMADAGVRAAKPGDWAQLNQSWLPEYSTRLRGASRIAHIVSVTNIDPAWRRFIVETGGAAMAVLANPVLGSITVDVNGIVSVPITSAPAAPAEVEVQIAFDPAAAPAANSNKWQTFARRAPGVTVQSPQIPIGQRGYIRARSVQEGRRPSGYTAAVQVIPPARPRILSLEFDRNASGQPVLTVTVSEPDTDVIRVYSGGHASSDPYFIPTSFTDYGIDGSGQVTFTQIITDDLFTIEVEPRTTGGTAGPRERRTITGAASALPGQQYAQFTLLSLSSTQATVRVFPQDTLGGVQVAHRTYPIDATAPLPAYSAYASVVGGFIDIVVPRDKRVATYLDVLIRDASGTESAPQLFDIDPLFPHINRTTGTVINFERGGDVNFDPRKIFAKSLAADPDIYDSIPEGITHKKILAQDVSAGRVLQAQRQRIDDVRSTNEAPSWYAVGTTREFKERTAIGAPGAATYGELITIKSYPDSSGGHATQEFRASDGAWKRTGPNGGTNSSDWGAWHYIIEAQEQRIHRATGHLTSTMQESGGREVNRLLAKSIAADPDTMDAVQEGVTHGKIQRSYLDAGRPHRLRRANDDVTAETLGGGIGVDTADICVNGGGQMGVLGAQAPGWALGNSPGLIIANDFAKFGDRSLKIDSPGGGDAYSSQEWAIAAGQFVEISGWIKTTALTGSGLGAVLNITPQSGSFVNLEKINYITFPGGPSDLNSCGLPQDGVARDWTFVRSLLRCDTAGTLRIYAHLGYAGVVTGTAWFDGIKVKIRTATQLRGWQGPSQASNPTLIAGVNTAGDLWVPAANRVGIGANGSPAVVTLEIYRAAADFNGLSDDTKYIRPGTAGFWENRAGQNCAGIISLDVPLGCTITKLKARLWRGATGSPNASITKSSQTGTTESAWTVTHSGASNAWEEPETTLSQLVASTSIYTLGIFANGTSDSDTKIAWVKVFIDISNYLQQAG